MHSRTVSSLLAVPINICNNMPAPQVPYSGRLKRPVKGFFVSYLIASRYKRCWMNQFSCSVILSHNLFYCRPYFCPFSLFLRSGMKNQTCARSFSKRPRLEGSVSVTEPARKAVIQTKAFGSFYYDTTSLYAFSSIHSIFFRFIFLGLFDKTAPNVICIFFDFSREIFI